MIRYQFLKTYLADTNTSIDIARLIAQDVNLQYGYIHVGIQRKLISNRIYFSISTYFVSVM